MAITNIIGAVGDTLKNIPLFGDFIQDVVGGGQETQLEKWCESQGGVMVDGKCEFYDSVSQGDLDSIRQYSSAMNGESSFQEAAGQRYDNMSQR